MQALFVATRFYLPSFLLSLLLSVVPVKASVAAAEMERQKLIALDAVSVEMLYAIGAESQLIAAVRRADYPEAAKDLPRVGQHQFLDLEKILLLQPDYILVNRQQYPAALLAQLSKFNLSIIDTGIEQISEIPQRLLELGNLTGQQAQAQQVAMDFIERYQYFKLASPFKETVSVFYQLFEEPLITVAQGWLAEVITLCGGHNVFSTSQSAYPQVNLEQVLLAKPQVIIQAVDQQEPARAAPNWRQWSEIPAVRQQQIYTIDSDLLHRAGPRLIDGITQVCQFIEQARKQGEKA